MTRIPTTTDPRSRTPARVRVPSSQLASPALGKVGRNFNVHDPEFWDEVEDIAVATGALSDLPFVAPYRMARRLSENLTEKEQQPGPVKPKRN